MEIDERGLDIEEQLVVDRLIKAAVEPDVRRDMDVEDEILSEILNLRIKNLKARAKNLKARAKNLKAKAKNLKAKARNYLLKTRCLLI